MKLLVRVAGRGFRFLRRLNARRASRTISEVEFSGLLRNDVISQEIPQYFRFRGNPSFFFKGKTAELPEESLARSREIVEDADEICAHNFNLLGSGESQVDRELGKIDWHKDFKSGMRWNPRVFYTDTQIIKGSGSDIKVPWELSRFQHLPALGKAYWFTGDEKYAREFVNEIKDWIENNPPQYGVNWTCTMDVAIRIINWIWGYYFFKDSPEVTNEFLIKFIRSLIIHGRHIRANLERGFLKRNGNHYLSGITGLVYLGVMFPEFKEAKEWHEFGIKELISEMKRQVYPDGVDYEGSISYHRLVNELFLSATLLCLENSITFPSWYMMKLEKMIEFVMYYTKPDGTTPQIGDNDDGRLHVLANYENWNRLDHRYLLSIGAVLFNRPDFKQVAGELHEEAFWLLGEAGLPRFNGLPNQKRRASSQAFRRGGFYIMRSDNLYMIVDCVSADPKAPSGHKHNSRLSFELFAYDKSFIIDPGAYIYTADKEMRNLFRGTRYHNTVVVDSEEQNRFNEDELFSMGRDATVKVSKWESTDGYDFLDAEHPGYKRFKNPVVHRRHIYFNKLEGYWVVKDILRGEGNHQFDLFFHFAPLEIGLDNEFPLTVTTRIEGANLALIPLEAEGVSVEILDGWVSCRYGAKEKAPIVRYSKNSQAPTSFCNILYPYIGKIDIKEIIEKANKARLDMPSMWED